METNKARPVRRGWHPILLALAALALVFAAPLAWSRYEVSLGPLDLAASREGSTVVVDRDGRLLRPFTLPDGRWRLPATTHDVEPLYLAMLVAYEDGRFWEHRGVDTRALLRAALQWMWRGHVVSGGSTLSMQVARLIAVPIHARGCEFSNRRSPGSLDRRKLYRQRFRDKLPLQGRVHRQQNLDCSVQRQDRRRVAAMPRSSVPTAVVRPARLPLDRQ